MRSLPSLSLRALGALSSHLELRKPRPCIAGHTNQPHPQCATHTYIDTSTCVQTRAAPDLWTDCLQKGTSAHMAGTCSVPWPPGDRLSPAWHTSQEKKTAGDMVTCWCQVHCMGPQMTHQIKPTGVIPTMATQVVTTETVFQTTTTPLFLPSRALWAE